MRFLRPIFPAFLLFLAHSGWAGGFADPLDTDAQVSLRSSSQRAAREVALPCATSLPATALTASEAVDLALCRHPQSREVWAAARQQAAQLGLARSAWWPGLNGSATGQRYFYEQSTYNRGAAALTLSWLIADFGQRSANIEAARQVLGAAVATQDATVQALFLAALQSYYTAQATQAAVSSAGEAERAAQESFAAADSRYKVGAGTPADRLLARTALSQATLSRVRAEGEARNARGALAYALGFDASQKITLAELSALVPDKAFLQDVDALIEEARRRRPDLLAAEAQFKAAQANVDYARAQGRPTLSLAAGPTWQDVGGSVTQGGNVGLTLNIPIFSGFATTYSVRSAAALADVRAAQRDRLHAQVALDVWKAYQGLGTATQSLSMTADLVAGAEQSAQVALGRYKAGVGTVLDLLTAQSALASARLQAIQAALDWQIYRATLAQAMGALDDTLLQPAVEGRP